MFTEYAAEPTNYTEQCFSWEADSSSASKKIPRILRHAKVHYRIHKITPPVHIRSQINPIHALSHFFKIHFNIILLASPKSSK
jgi:hypothetical protein